MTWIEIDELRHFFRTIQLWYATGFSEMESLSYARIGSKFGVHVMFQKGMELSGFFPFVKISQSSPQPLIGWYVFHILMGLGRN